MDIKPTNLASRSVQVLYGKATDEQLFEYKKLLDKEFRDRGVDKTFILSAYDDDYKWGYNIHNEVLPLVVKSYLKKHVKFLNDNLKSVLIDYLIIMLRLNDKEEDADMVRAELDRYSEILSEEFSEDQLEYMFRELEEIQLRSKYLDDDSTNPYIIKAAKKLHKRNPESTPGVILLTIRVPLGNHIEIYSNKGGEYPVMVDD